ncbi:p-hydroxybenzoic acid efflux pump subunit AaeA [Pseudomonas aeruginosa]|uniref:efflux RND transporter periplasmic adaptor subunit n=1 Tax=Pseudomonas aeruginosa TaxID=287 RepID=UPI001A291C65|nr:HlyD family secretion protein [Pseudomonas aeruginosa]MBH9390311.1 HlyD family secretion protein [Pseudomonas aeruginosa]WBH96403.1 p-hydroxybenzoic acid efflux pump subunit AaeA [Pseudomonas aeruginosa]
MSIVRLSKVAATFACGLLALCLALQLWQAYVLAPWTRDGRVSAQVLRIAPEVSGSVEAVFVADNQRVARGDPLYRIDPRSYRLAVRQREAELEQARETLRQRDEQWRRRMQLAGAVSREEVANAGRALRIARARAEAAGAALDQARLDLRRSELRSPVDGYVTQLRVQPGDYAAAGRTNIFIVDRRSFWVTGYFEETKLRNVQVGAPATIKLMGFDPLLDGHVASIGRGVADLNESRADSGLPQVSPNFSWIRLAQRVPVRIELDRVPAGVVLAAGMTGSVEVLQAGTARHWRLTRWLQEYL